MGTPTADDEARAARLAELERTIHDLVIAGDVSAATTRAVEGYGAELLGYLFAIARTPDAAEELFSELCEKLWRALPQFRWESSFRTWAYAIARNLVRESYRQSERQGKVVGLSSAPEVAEQVQAVRTTTVAYMKTETKKRLEMLRDALDEDDRTLLVLRVDRKMAWRDIARVMAEGNDEAGDLDRFAAALRKRFERVKERLRNKLADPAAGA